MSLRATHWNRIASLVGLLCLGTTLVLLPAGIRVARADEGVELLMSVDPLLVAAEEVAATQPAAAGPVVPGEGGDEIRPGVSAREVQPGVIVLNTRGYNYGPRPAAIDPAAMQRESGMP